MQSSRLVVLALSLSPALAQAPALKDVHRVLPTFRETFRGQALGDVNGDLRVDLVIAGNQSPGEVWLASAGGTFTRLANAMPVFPNYGYALVLVDIDGDGDRDCVAANGPGGSTQQGGDDRVLINDGTGHFQESLHSPLAGSNMVSPCIAAPDIDGDGDQDVVIGGATTRVYVNNGAGQFVLDSNRLAPMIPAGVGLDFLDYDGDGDVDLFLGRLSSTYTGVGDCMYVNNGLGYFTATFVPGSVHDDMTNHAAARDFDADGDTDLLLVRTLVPNLTPAVRYLVNNGTGSFTVVAAPSLFPYSSQQLIVGDWNGDLLTDYALRVNGQVHAFVLTAAGQFQPSQLPVAGFGERTVHALDFDGDGDSDLLAASKSTYAQGGPLEAMRESSLLRNFGNAWADIPARDFPTMPFRKGTVQQVADIDLDGHLDVIWSPTQWNGGRIFRGSGAGSFVQLATGAFGGDASNTRSMAFGDVDLDGDVDIVCANDGGVIANTPSRLYRRTSGTFFTIAPLPALYASSAALGDVDGDNDLDLLLGGVQGTILTNDGTGTFTVLAGALPPAATWFIGGAFADFDGDTDLDIAACNGGWLRNNGSGFFTHVPVPGMPTAGNMQTADFDADGDPDLLVGWGQNQLLLNNGTGSFSSHVVPAPVSAWSGVAPIDVDGDGLRDIVYHDTNSTPSAGILRNTGGGSFVSLPGSVIEASPNVLWMNPGDFDEDGDVDLLVATEQATSIWRNLHHQLAWRSLPRVGFPLDLDLFGRANEPYVLGLSFVATPWPLGAFGTLHLDLAWLLVVASGQYDPNGAASFSLVVPAMPALIGLPVYWQALSGVQARFGNLEVTRLEGS
jgi:hypothetical protein